MSRSCLGVLVFIMLGLLLGPARRTYCLLLARIAAATRRHRPAAAITPAAPRVAPSIAGGRKPIEVINDAKPPITARPSKIMPEVPRIATEGFIYISLDEFRITRA